MKKVCVCFSATFCVPSVFASVRWICERKNFFLSRGNTFTFLQNATIRLYDCFDLRCGSNILLFMLFFWVCVWMINCECIFVWIAPQLSKNVLDLGLSIRLVLSIIYCFLVCLPLGRSLIQRLHFVFALDFLFLIEKTTLFCFL